MNPVETVFRPHVIKWCILIGHVKLRLYAFEVVKLQSAGYRWLVLLNTCCFACIFRFALYRWVHVGAYWVVWLVIVFGRSIAQGLTFRPWSGNWLSLHSSRTYLNGVCMDILWAMAWDNIHALRISFISRWTLQAATSAGGEHVVGITWSERFLSTPGDNFQGSTRGLPWCSKNHCRHSDISRAIYPHTHSSLSSVRVQVWPCSNGAVR